MQRIFIGLWPDEQTVEAIRPLSAAALQHCGGRALHAVHWHITLAFLGSLPQDRVQQLCAHSRQWQVPVAPFQIDCFGSFAHSRVLWLGSSAPASLQAMQHSFDSLWAELKPLGFYPENRPFTPHVSLLRRAQRLSLAQLPEITPFDWQSAHCSVMVSQPGPEATHYHPLARIALRPHKGQK